MLENYKKDRTKTIEETVNYIVNNYSYGDKININKIENLFKVNCKEPLYWYLMSKLKNKLLEKGFCLATITNNGYKILEPNEITEYIVFNKLPKIKNSLSNVKKILEYTPKEFLNKEELQEFNNISSTVENINTDFGKNLLQMQLKIGKMRIEELSESENE